MSLLVRFLASAGFVGYVGFVAGTFGSLEGLALSWFLPGLDLWILLALTAVGFAICPASEKAFGRKDPDRYVLDEVCGMMLSVLWVPRVAVLYWIGFVLFRIFDSWKPGPIRRIQNHPSPYGIMWDDLAAGLLTNLILQAIVLLKIF